MGRCTSAMAELQSYLYVDHRRLVSYAHIMWFCSFILCCVVPYHLSNKKHINSIEVAITSWNWQIVSRLNLDCNIAYSMFYHIKEEKCRQIPLRHKSNKNLCPSTILPVTRQCTVRVRGLTATSRFRLTHLAPCAVCALLPGLRQNTTRHMHPDRNVNLNSLFPCYFL